MRVPDVIVANDFLADPGAVRRYALQQPFVRMRGAGLRTRALAMHTVYEITKRLREKDVNVCFGIPRSQVTYRGTLTCWSPSRRCRTTS
jgi:hypothetical protein